MKKVDNKNVELAKILLRLRQDIDVHRVIGLNVARLESDSVPKATFGHIQQTALNDAALCFCKIYELEGDRYELNSICGVIRSLQELTFTDVQRRDSQKFASSVGGTQGDDLVQNLRSAFRKVVENHITAIERLRTFRDKFAAHSEHGFVVADLPSHGEFESLYEFAYRFYCFVSEHVVGVGPALIGREVGMGLVRHFKNLGIDGIQWDFPHKKGPNR